MSPSPDEDPYTHAAGPDSGPEPRSAATSERLHLLAQDELPSHALGEGLDPELDVHVRDCARCQEELTLYRSLAELARAEQLPDEIARPVPAPEVWSRIRAELAGELGQTGELDQGGGRYQDGAPAVEAEPARGRHAAPETSDAMVRPFEAPARSYRRRRLAAGLLAAAAIAAAGFTGWVIGHHASAPSSTAQAALSAQPGTTATASGKAVMRNSADGYQMQVSTSGLPAPAGYYEVWLFDPSTKAMVAVGTLGTGARGTFTIPAGIDTRAYHVVDVSNQRYDGNAAHQTSVLRGSLADA